MECACAPVTDNSIRAVIAKAAAVDEARGSFCGTVGRGRRARLRSLRSDSLRTHFREDSCCEGLIPVWSLGVDFPVGRLLFPLCPVS